MLKRHSQLFEALFTSLDLLVVSLAWVASYFLRFTFEIVPVEKGIPPFLDYLKILIFVWPIWAYVFRRFGLYRPMRGVSVFRESWRVIRANAMSVIMLVSVTYLFREKSVPFSRAVFVIFLIVSTVSTVWVRLFVREALRYMRRRGHNLRYAVVVGAGQLAENIASRMRLHPEYGIELLGCLQGDPPLRDRGLRSLPGPELVYPDYGRPAYPWGSAMGQAGRGGDTQGNTRLKIQPDTLAAVGKEKVIGFYSDLPDILQNYNIDQVIIAVPLADHDKLESIVASIGDEMVDVRIVPDIHRFIQLGSEIEEFDGLPVVSLASTPLVGINRLLKRGFDLFFGAIFTLLSLPVMIFTALLIKCSSRGPVLFVQERVGLDGQKFPIYKFRTMKVDAESSGARFAVRNDPRTTAIGGLLRKLSLDELPQLFNVLMGHMSLVGPRPERPVFIEEFRQRVPKYMLRHKVQAGMTGWAQVNGWRGNTSIERRIEHDLYYIEHWSILLDLRIILLTLICGLWNKNAY